MNFLKIALHASHAQMQLGVIKIKEKRKNSEFIAKYTMKTQKMNETKNVV